MTDSELSKLHASILALTKKVDKLTRLVRESERNAVERHAFFMNIDEESIDPEEQGTSELLLDVPPSMRKFLPKN
jgi:hypothetical protein